MTITKSGERVINGGPGFYKAALVGGPRDGEVLEAIGFSLPSEIRYPVNGDNSFEEHRYTLRGTRSSGYYYDYIGVVNVP